MNHRMPCFCVKIFRRTLALIEDHGTKSRNSMRERTQFMPLFSGAHGKSREWTARWARQLLGSPSGEKSTQDSEWSHIFAFQIHARNSIGRNVKLQSCFISLLDCVKFTTPQNNGKKLKSHFTPSSINKRKDSPFGVSPPASGPVPSNQTFIKTRCSLRQRVPAWVDSDNILFSGSKIQCSETEYGRSQWVSCHLPWELGLSFLWSVMTQSLFVRFQWFWRMFLLCV